MSGIILFSSFTLIIEMRSFNQDLSYIVSLSREPTWDSCLSLQKLELLMDYHYCCHIYMSSWDPNIRFLLLQRKQLSHFPSSSMVLISQLFLEPNAIVLLFSNGHLIYRNLQEFWHKLAESFYHHMWHPIPITPEQWALGM